MAKYLYFIATIITLCCNNCTAQDEQPALSTISLSVIMPASLSGISASQLSGLETKITSIVSENGIGASGYSQGFVIYPKFEVNDVKESQSGMRKLTVANCNLSLFIKQVSSGAIFASYNRSIQGSGFGREEAINNALNRVDPADAALISFITKAKEKILNYYTQNCDIIIQKAETERLQKKYESALAALLSVPAEAASCYKKAQPKAIAVFREMEQYNCKKYLRDAQTMAAGKDFDGALKRLSWIDPTVNCGSEAKTLLRSISAELSQDKKKEWDLLFKIYDGEIEIAKAQASAMNSVAGAWLMTQSSVVSYDFIISF